MSYKNKVFSHSTPEEQYMLQLDSLETRVNNFIDRSYAEVLKQANQLKTEKGRKNRLEKYFISMEEAFYNCHSFWSGNPSSPHYTGKLYTENNLKKLTNLKETALIFQ